MSPRRWRSTFSSDRGKRTALGSRLPRLTHCRCGGHDVARAGDRRRRWNGNWPRHHWGAGRLRLPRAGAVPTRRRRAGRLNRVLQPFLRGAVRGVRTGAAQERRPSHRSANEVHCASTKASNFLTSGQWVRSDWSTVNGFRSLPSSSRPAVRAGAGDAAHHAQQLGSGPTSPRRAPRPLRG